MQLPVYLVAPVLQARIISTFHFIQSVTTHKLNVISLLDLKTKVHSQKLELNLHTFFGPEVAQNTTYTLMEFL